MLTNSDFTKLKSIFATKEDLEKLRDVFVTKGEFLSGFDEVMFELRAIREELTLGSYRRSENSDLFDDHGIRITSIEKKISF